MDTTHLNLPAQPAPQLAADEQILVDASGKVPVILTVVLAAGLAIGLDPAVQSYAWFGWPTPDTIWFRPFAILTGLLLGTVVAWVVIRESLGARMVVTSYRLHVYDGRKRAVYDRSLMSDVRYYFDGGLAQAISRPWLEFEYSGYPVKLEVKVPDWKRVVSELTGNDVAKAGVMAGATRRRIS